jgi:hypothetical protein
LTINWWHCTAAPVRIFLADTAPSDSFSFYKYAFKLCAHSTYYLIFRLPIIIIFERKVWTWVKSKTKEKYKINSVINRYFVFVSMRCACCWLGSRFILYGTVAVIVSKRSLMPFSSGCHWFLGRETAFCIYVNKLWGLNMNCVLTLSVFYHRCFYSSLRFVLRSWGAHFLNV